MNKQNIITSFINAVAEAEAIGCYDGTYHWYLNTDDRSNDWAIVMSYMDYDGDGNERLYAKVAYQPSNSIMQCDYDIDWIMPYDYNTDDVWDTEISISSNTAKADIEWLLDQFDLCVKFELFTND